MKNGRNSKIVSNKVKACMLYRFMIFFSYKIKYLNGYCIN